MSETVAVASVADVSADENTLMVYISHLRDKIEDNAREPRCIVTVWGIGYRFESGKEGSI